MPKTSATNLQPKIDERPILVLEKQLLDTLELQWCVQRARIRLNGASTTKALILFNGIAGELEVFADMIRKRLEYWTPLEPTGFTRRSNSNWRLFPVGAVNAREQIEALSCDYTRYLRRTLEAMTSLRLAGDLQSYELLNVIFRTAERSLSFLEMYAEALAMNIDDSRLPEWSPE